MIIRKKLYILILLTLNCFVENISTESFYHSSFLKQLKECFETGGENICKEMILLTEQMHIGEYYKGNFKCQTSLLGLQTELIKNIYFDKNQKKLSEKTIPFLIKNC